MSDLKVSCPLCHQALAVREELLGHTLLCPFCKSQFQLPAPAQAQPETHETKDCPFCGEQILAKAKKCKHCGEFLDGAHTTQPKSPQVRPEEEVWRGNPSILYYLGFWIIGGAFFVSGLVSGFAFADSSYVGLSGVGAWILIYSILDQRTRVFTLTTHRAMSKVGIIAKKTSEVSIRDIRSVGMSQGIFERLFGLGTVGVASAGTAGVEVQFKGISGPTAVRDLVRRTKDETDR